MKRYLFLIIGLMLLMPMAVSAAAMQEPAAAAERVLTIGTMEEDVRFPYASNLPVFQEIEKNTGIKIIWEALPQDQFTTAMQARIAASPDTLPDIIRLPRGDPVKWGMEGIIIPLEDLIEQHAPNTVRLFTEYPSVQPLVTAPDGHLYFLPSLTPGQVTANPFTIHIRTDWLEKLGLEEPDTIDDWYQVLRAFKDGDPNGNGRSDEIPFHGYRLSWLGRWGESWGLRLFVYSKGWSVDANDMVLYDYLDPKAREVYTWLRKLYAEGLLDPDLTVTGDISVARRTTDVTGAFFDFGAKAIQWTNNIQKAGFPDAHYKPMVPPEGPYGDRISETGGMVSGGYAITKASKNPVLAIEWLDYVYAHPDANDLFMYGIEGKSYVREDGQIKFTDFVLDNPDGMGTFESLRSLGGWPNVPYVQTQEAYDLLNLEFPEVLEFTIKTRPYIVDAFPRVLPTSEESEQLPAIMTDIDTFRDEFLSRFIIGAADEGEWDDFVQTLQGMGIDRARAIKQAQWDRFRRVQ